MERGLWKCGTQIIVNSRNLWRFLRVEKYLKSGPELDKYGTRNLLFELLFCLSFLFLNFLSICFLDIWRQVIGMLDIKLSSIRANNIRASGLLPFSMNFFQTTSFEEMPTQWAPAHLKMNPSTLKKGTSALHWKMKPTFEKLFLEKKQHQKLPLVSVSLFYLLFGCPMANFRPLLRGELHSSNVNQFL